MIHFFFAQIFSWMDGQKPIPTSQLQTNRTIKCFLENIFIICPKQHFGKKHPRKSRMFLDHLPVVKTVKLWCRSDLLRHMGGCKPRIYYLWILPPEIPGCGMDSPVTRRISQPFFRCRETPQPRPSTGFGSHFLLILKWSRHKKHGGPPAVNIPQTAKLKVLGFPQGMGFQVWFISSNLVHLHLRFIFVFWGAKSFPAVHGMGLFFPPKN